MKTVKEWYDTTEAQLETIRAIQADALEAAAKLAEGDEKQWGWQSGGSQIAVAIRRMKDAL